MHIKASVGGYVHYSSDLRVEQTCVKECMTSDYQDISNRYHNVFPSLRAGSFFFWWADSQATYFQRVLQIHYNYCKLKGIWNLYAWLVYFDHIRGRIGLRSLFFFAIFTGARFTYSEWSPIYNISCWLFGFNFPTCRFAARIGLLSSSFVSLCSPEFKYRSLATLKCASECLVRFLLMFFGGKFV